MDTADFRRDERAAQDWRIAAEQAADALAYYVGRYAHTMIVGDEHSISHALGLIRAHRDRAEAIEHEARRGALDAERKAGE